MKDAFSKSKAYNVAMQMNPGTATSIGSNSDSTCQKILSDARDVIDSLGRKNKGAAMSAPTNVTNAKMARLLVSMPLDNLATFEEL